MSRLVLPELFLPVMATKSSSFTFLIRPPRDPMVELMADVFLSTRPSMRAIHPPPGGTSDGGWLDAEVCWSGLGASACP